MKNEHAFKYYDDMQDSIKEYFPFLSSISRVQEAVIHLHKNLSSRDGENIWLPRVEIAYTKFIELKKYDIIKKYGLCRKILEPTYSQEMIWNNQYGFVIDVNIFDTMDRIERFASYKPSQLKYRYGFPRSFHIHGTFTEEHLLQIMEIIKKNTRFFMEMYKGDVAISYSFISTCIECYLVENNFCIYDSYPRRDGDNKWQDWLEYHEQIAIAKEAEGQQVIMPDLPKQTH